MPLINVKLIEDVFTPEQKGEMVEKLTDAMVSIEGENLRGVTWVVIEEVQSGASPMSGKIARTVVEYFQKLQGAAPQEGEYLSKREEEILNLLAKGFRYKEIADALSIGYETVRSHLKNIYDKLHVHSRTEAVVKYLRK